MRLSSLGHLLEERVNLLPESYESLMNEWRQELSFRVAELDPLLNSPAEAQFQQGYFHTLKEIYQQPFTWLETAATAVTAGNKLQAFLADARLFDGNGTLILNGSGSSHFVGACLTYSLQASLRISVQNIPSGLLLTHTDQVIARDRPCVTVSFARSGESPESRGVLELLLEKIPLCRHLIITCNRNGRLATDYKEDSRVCALILDDKTCDRSLVMTSSFTNMALAGLVLGMLEDPLKYHSIVANLAQIGSDLLLNYSGALARVANREFKSAVYLGSGGRYGSARESALKMLEMTAGQVMAFSETFLGLRHGPMSAVRPETLVVCFLSSDPLVRAYELDLIAELNRKGLGMQKVIVGDEVPREIVMPSDLVVECPGLGALGDENVPVLHVLTGQLLAFFCCLRKGLKPDSPSNDGVISRVVESFKIHKR